MSKKRGQDVEDPVDLQDQRRGAEELDEGGRREPDRRERRQPQQRQKQPARDRERHGDHGERDRDQRAACRSSGRIVPDDRPVEGHDEPRCGEAPVEPVDAARDRIAEQEVDQHRAGVDLERPEGLAGHDLRLPHQLGHGDHRGDGAVLDRDHQQRAERRQHADQRLRQDDRAHRLRAAHAERQRRPHLAAAGPRSGRRGSTSAT